MNNNQTADDVAAKGNLFFMLGQLYAENQILRQEIARLQQQIAQSQQPQANGKDADSSGETVALAERAKT